MQTADYCLATRHLLTRVDGKRVWITSIDGGTNRQLAAELVVFISANRSNNELADVARGIDVAVHVIGDALAPGDLHSAIASGNEASLGI